MILNVVSLIDLSCGIRCPRQWLRWKRSGVLRRSESSEHDILGRQKRGEGESCDELLFFAPVVVEIVYEQTDPKKFDLSLVQ